MDVKAKTLILGDMLELGEQSAIEHQNIIDLLQQNKLVNVLLVGSEFGKTRSHFMHFKDVNELINHLKEYPIRNEYVLIKGSRGIKLENILTVL